MVETSTIAAIIIRRRPIAKEKNTIENNRFLRRRCWHSACAIKKSKT
jgi:hypothetical protein